MSDWGNDPLVGDDIVFDRNKAWTKAGAKDFTTKLAPDQEKQFQTWVRTNDVPMGNDGPKSDYDMRGFWRALQSGDPKAKSAVDPNDKKLHYPDYWKTPYHETFSNESQWADPAKAPRWNDKDQLVSPDGKVLFDDRAPPKGKPESSNDIPTVTVTAKAPSARLGKDDLRKKITALGYSEAGADGIIQNIMRESRGDASVVGDGGTSLGLFQHHATRKADLEAFAKEAGKSATDPDVQIAFFDQEMKTKFPRLREQLTKADNAGVAEDAFKRIYERPASVLWANRPNGKPVLETDDFKYSPYAMKDKRRNTDVVLMSPDDYLALSPDLDADAMNSRKGKSLRASLGRGDPIEAIPTLDMAVKDGQGTITDQDGRHRAMAAQEAGADAVPVAIRRTGTGPVTEVQGMGGKIVPHDFNPLSWLVSSAQAAEPAKADDWGNDPLVGAGWGNDPITSGKPDYTGWDTATIPTKPSVEAAVPLRNDPNKTYGTVLPFAKDNTTGKLEFAVPEMIRAPIRGVVEGGQEALGQRPVGDPSARDDIFSAASLGVGGAPGATVRAASGGGAPAFRPMYEFASRLAGKDIAKDPAALAVVKRLESDAAAGGPTAKDMIDLVNATPNKPLTLADVAGENVLQFAGKIARAPGESRQIMAKYLKERDAAAAGRLVSDLDSKLAGGSSYDAATALSEARATAAAPKYETAFSQPVTMAEVRPVQRYIHDQIGQEAIQKGMRIAEIESLGVGSAKFFDPEKYGVVRGKSGRWIVDPDVLSGKKAPSMRFLDAVKRGYDEIVEGFRDPTSGRLNLNQYGRAVNNARADYVGYLRQTFPPYAEALNAWSGPSQSLDALRAGEGFMRQRPEEIARRIGSMSEGDREFYKMGAADTIRKNIATKGASADEAKAILKHDYARSQLRPLFNDEAAYNDFVRAVEAEGRMFGTKYEILGNSKTAGRVAEDADPEMEALASAARAGVHAAHGNVFGVGANAMRSITALMSRNDPKFNADIARLLTTPLAQPKISGRMNFLNDMMMRMPATRNHILQYAPPSGRLLAPATIDLGSNNGGAP